MDHIMALGVAWLQYWRGCRAESSSHKFPTHLPGGATLFDFASCINNGSKLHTGGAVCCLRLGLSHMFWNVLYCTRILHYVYAYAPSYGRVMYCRRQLRMGWIQLVRNYSHKYCNFRCCCHIHYDGGFQPYLTIACCSPLCQNVIFSFPRLCVMWDRRYALNIVLFVIQVCHVAHLSCFIRTRTPPVEAHSRGRTGCYLFTVSNSGLLSVQRQPVDHAHRHRHILELTCGFNSSID